MQWHHTTVSLLYTKGQLNSVPWRYTSLRQWGMNHFLCYHLYRLCVHDFMSWWKSNLAGNLNITVRILASRFFWPQVLTSSPLCLILLFPHSLPFQACTGSICERYGLEVCTCGSEDGKDDTELCHVCCMKKSEYCTPTLALVLNVVQLCCAPFTNTYAHIQYMEDYRSL